jgi:hypothetical protein
MDGKFGRMPRAADLGRDPRGRLQDSSGSYVPVSAVRDAPVREILPQKGDISRIRKGETIVDKEFLSSSWRNKTAPEDLADIFSNMLERHAAKGPFQPDDVLVYEHGLKFVGPFKLSEPMIDEISEIIGNDYNVKYIDTKAGTEVYIYLGDAPKVLGQTSRSLEQSEEVTRRLYDALVDYWSESIDWYIWAEVDEALYG